MAPSRSHSALWNNDTHRKRKRKQPANRKRRNCCAGAFIESAADTNTYCCQFGRPKLAPQATCSRKACQCGKQNDPGRTRACNPRLRRPMPYPLDHGASCIPTFVHCIAYFSILFGGGGGSSQPGVHPPPGLELFAPSPTLHRQYRDPLGMGGGAPRRPSIELRQLDPRSFKR